MIPVFSFLILPLILAAIGLPLILVRRSLATARAGYKEKREHQRFASFEETVAKVTVGGTTCTALVSNISQSGICLKHLPEIFSYGLTNISVVIRQYGVDYNFLAVAKWTELTDSGKKIGVEIDTAPPGWNQLCLQTANG